MKVPPQFLFQGREGRQVRQASLTVLVLHRHGVKYYNNTSAPKNVVVAENFLKTLPLSLYISDLDVSVLVQPLYVAYLTMEITKNSKNTDNIIAYCLLGCC